MDDEGYWTECSDEVPPHPVETAIIEGSNMVANVASSARELWKNIQSSVSFTRRRAASSISRNKLECSFVQPTLMSLGKFSDEQTDDLLHILQGQPFALWNLSGQNFSEKVKESLRGQVLDAPWLLPGQFSQIPSLEYIFSLCYSIKSWLDLHSDHIAVIYCQNGRSRSGILIACFLKFISAFETASHAFDFFCSSRAQTEIKASLAPSYRILFDNMDKIVDRCITRRFQHRPVHLKSLTISGLPVDEIPCVEIWDLTGQVYISHQNFKVKNTEDKTWSSDYGDGIFRIAADILGDFSIMVRFGGAHAMKRDHSTIIFKYHNHSGVLLPETIELRKQSVDVNPEYDDSLDIELFSVHLALESASQDKVNFIIQDGIEDGSNHEDTRSNFEAGLDEISKLHSQVPDPELYETLVNRGFPKSYAAVALQLSSNTLDQAAGLVDLMQTHIKDNVQPIRISPSPSLNIEESPGVARTWKTVGSVVTPDHHPHSSPLPVSNLFAESSKSTASISEVLQYTNQNVEQGSQKDSPKGDGASNFQCLICKQDNQTLRDQLVPCTACKSLYHTECCNKRRIPFGSQSLRDTQNRAKYIEKYFSNWVCASCEALGVKSPSANVVTDLRDLLAETPRASVGDSSYTTPPVSILQHAKNDQTPADKFARMLLAGIPKNAVQEKMRSRGVSPADVERSLQVLKDTEDTEIQLKNHPIYEKYFRMLSFGIPAKSVKLKMHQEGQDPNILDKNPEDPWQASTGDDNSATQFSCSVPSGGESCLAKDHPVYAKYFKMLKVGLPVATVKHKMAAEGADPKTQHVEKKKLANPLAGPDWVPIKEHSFYGKYYKMLAMGLPPGAVKNRMAKEGIDPDILDTPANELVPPDEDIGKSKTAPPNATSLAIPTKKRGPRRKRLYWKSIDASQVREGSLWADDGDQGVGIDIDEEEFAKLFVDANSPRKKAGETTPPSGASRMKNVASTRKEVVYLIDMKRGQNACIALSRVKVAFADIRAKLSVMDDRDFTAATLGFIKEYLPTPEEANKLKKYQGDRASLGQAEIFMMEMLDFPEATSILDCLLFKKQFQERAVAISDQLMKLDGACEDVKSSVRLKKVMKTILKVGNQMNADSDEKSHGFRLDSLLKLQSAKAFDKKTSILQYVIMIIDRNDGDWLKFPEDLAHVGTSAKVSFESLLGEKEALEKDLEKMKTVVGQEVQRGVAIDLSTVGFISEAVGKFQDLETTTNAVNDRFLGLLEYFGEDPSMSSTDFFATLHRFMTEFVKERKKYMDEKKAKLRNATPASSTKAPTRRASLMSVQSPPVDPEKSQEKSPENEKKSRRGSIM
eukprot:GSChrysophyteH1.ASY1.ANO1.2051.1 assembled CDS